MKIENIFNSFVWSDTLDIDNTDLIKYAYQLQANNSGRIRSNRGGWQSQDLDLANTLIQPLIKTITEKINLLHIYLGFNDQLEQIIDNIWININPPGSYNEYHHHEFSFFSGAYYLSTTEQTGSIRFLNPIPVHDWVIPTNIIKEFNSFNSKSWEIIPKSNLLLLFPCWLRHGVNENTSNVDRISISFNTQLVKKT
jgi:hypothetical protein